MGLVDSLSGALGSASLDESVEFSQSFGGLGSLPSIISLICPASISCGVINKGVIGRNPLQVVSEVCDVNGRVDEAG